MVKYFTALMATILLLAVGFPAMADSRVSSAVGETGVTWKDKNIKAADAVRDVIDKWVDSWREKNIDRYMSFYSRSFRSEDLDYTGWQKKKAGLFKESGKINIQLKDLWVIMEGNLAEAGFIQHYRDARHSDTGEKIIHLYRNDDGQWKIISERWLPFKTPRQ